MNTSLIQNVSTWTPDAMDGQPAALPAEGEPWSQMGALTVGARTINCQGLPQQVLERMSTSFGN